MDCFCLATWMGVADRKGQREQRAEERIAFACLGLCSVLTRQRFAALHGEAGEEKREL
jgi:hypothetical protein